MRLKLAYSPCPNDTFAFHAMVHGLVDTEGLEFETILADVEQLNMGAAAGKFEICKLSYHAFFQLAESYVMLRSGSALGHHNGPLLVTPEKSHLSGLRGEELEKALAAASVLIPGKMTTGALLLKVAFPMIQNTTPVIFSDIEKLVLDGSFDAGVLIHEARFTYREKGLSLITDLGEHWQKISGLPVPLGGIAVTRRLDPGTARKVNRVLRRSIEFAMNNPSASQEYVTCHAREMDPVVQKQHIELFVNDFSIDIGVEGERAAAALFRKLTQVSPEIIFRDDLFIL
jgi:1,4-dihydroxy-6-naphthoate synthase